MLYQLSYYCHWGRTVCPSEQGTEQQEGAIFYSHNGGAANIICMHHDPDHLQFCSTTAI